MTSFFSTSYLTMGFFNVPAPIIVGSAKHITQIDLIEMSALPHGEKEMCIELHTSDAGDESHEIHFFPFELGLVSDTDQALATMTSVNYLASTFIVTSRVGKIARGILAVVINRTGGTDTLKTSRFNHTFNPNDPDVDENLPTNEQILEDFYATTTDVSRDPSQNIAQGTKIGTEILLSRSTT